MLKFSGALSALLLLSSMQLFVASAWAGENETHYDRIHLNVSATTQLENDTMVAIVYAQEEGSDVSALSNTVNKRIRKGLNLVKKYSKIKHQTNAYTSNPIYSSNKIKGWRVSQSLRLESQDMTLMSDVLGKLQNDLALQSMQFTISPELRNQQDEKLIDEALTSFGKRAQQVTEKLGRKNYKIVEINISTSGNGNFRPQLEMRQMKISSMSTAPAVSAGEQSVSVTVTGSIELE